MQLETVLQRKKTKNKFQLLGQDQLTRLHILQHMWHKKKEVAASSEKTKKKSKEPPTEEALKKKKKLLSTASTAAKKAKVYLAMSPIEIIFTWKCNCLVPHLIKFLLSFCRLFKKKFHYHGLSIPLLPLSSMRRWLPLLWRRRCLALLGIHLQQ